MTISVTSMVSENGILEGCLSICPHPNAGGRMVNRRCAEAGGADHISQVFVQMRVAFEYGVTSPSVA
jgi:hypothetical protein